MSITISAVILAGGKARRMGGVDKGLQPWQGKPLFEHCIQRLSGQVQDIAINANRNHARYAESGLPVFADEMPDFQGPLSGMLTALARAKTDFVLFVPCDCPKLPLDLLARLKRAVVKSDIFLAYAHDGERDHPTFCLMSRQLHSALASYLAHGERRILAFIRQQGGIAVDFNDQKAYFINVNSLDELAELH